MSRSRTKTREDVVDLLVRQHSQIRDLFAAVENSYGDRRRESFGRLVRLLAVHETAEEEIVHPLARRRLPGGEEIVDDRLQEERKAKEKLVRLEGMDTENPRFLAELDELRIAVLTHARAEERYEFHRIRDELNAVQRSGLAAAVKAAEALAPTHPHPGVESATKNLLVGPVEAIADRVRDLIRGARS
jgi:Hemerythrin HHE cation binding domain